MKMMLERKEQSLFRGDLSDAQLEIKEVSDDGEFEGYGAIFNTVDQGGDIILPGAFNDSLQAIPAGKVKMLWQHDPGVVIGKYTEMREDSRGLYVKGRIFKDLPKGSEVHTLMKEGAIEGLSIGYRAKEFTLSSDRNEDWWRKLAKVDLREVSVVTFPMHEMAGIMAVKKHGELPTEREFERWLTRDAGFSAQQAKAIVASGFKSLLVERDAGNSDTTDADLASALAEAAQLFKA